MREEGSLSVSSVIKRLPLEPPSRYLQSLERQSDDFRFRRRAVLAARRCTFDATLGDVFHLVSQDLQLRGGVYVERAHEVIKAESADARVYRRQRLREQ